MKKVGTKLSATRLTTVLGILLGLAYLLVLSGRIATDDSPSVMNTSTGGLSAFAELLRQSGYRVRVEDDMRARFRPGEFVIIPLETGGPFQRRDLDDDPDETPPLSKRLPIAPGGAMVLDWSPNLSTPATRTYTNRVTRETLQVRTGTGEPSVRPITDGEPAVLIYKEDQTVSGIGGGTIKGRRVLHLQRGEMATNQYLDGPGNAALLVGLIRASTTGKEIVFYEGISAQGGLLASLGDWAFAARNQLLLAASLLVLSLGSRFGLAPKARRKESGQREQSDALGNLLRRWRGPRVPRLGIDAAIEQARRRLAQARRLPPSAPREQWDKYLSPSLIEAIEECEEWVRQRAKEREALRAIAKHDAETDAEILGPRTTTASKDESEGTGVYR